jgi:hypothetical protein
MTTRRAALPNATKPGPARIHFACVPIGEEQYYVGFSNCTRYGQRLLSVQNTAEQRELCSPRTEQQRESIEREKEAQSVVSERSDGAGLPGHGCNGNGTTALCAEIQPNNGQGRDITLKLLPAPQIAGLLPARVPVPTNGQREKPVKRTEQTFYHQSIKPYHPRKPARAYQYLTPERQQEYQQAMELNYCFKWELEEIEAAYADTKPHVVELFKRFHATRWFDDNGHEIVRG